MMRRILRNILSSILGMLSRSIIRKYRPTVVMVTGSVGKTSTKDAIAAALGQKFPLRKSEKSFNSEIGVPLTIIGVENPWSNVGAWLKVFKRAFSLLFLTKEYPKLLVLEVGADRPGDLVKICKIVKPSVVVVTFLPSVPVHVEAYETPEAVREEEFSPASMLPAGAPLIICADDEYAVIYAARLPHAALHTFGYTDAAEVRITKPHIWSEDHPGHGIPQGMQGSLQVGGKAYPFKVVNSFGKSQLYAPAAALATALSLGMTANEAMEGLRSYVLPPGRGHFLAGIRGTTLIDDSYNSSPVATEESLRSLPLLKPLRTVVVLGDMLELGRHSIPEHERIGHIAREYANVIVTVGSRARGIADAARADGMPEESIHSYETSVAASKALPALLQEGDTILVKGSQSIRMERIVRVLLASAEDSSKLVRQDAEWQKR